MRLAYRPSLSRRMNFAKIRHPRQAALRSLVLLTATLLLLLPAKLVGAQDIFGRISGAVTDPSGAAVTNAKVIITNQDTKLSRTVKTDDRGFYVAPELAVGTYTVTVEERGFKTITKA